MSTIVTQHNCTEAVGLSRAAFLRLAPTMPGARKVGRTWMVPTAAVLRWLDSQPGARAAAKIDEPTTPSDFLAAAGFGKVG